MHPILSEQDIIILTSALKETLILLSVVGITTLIAGFLLGSLFYMLKHPLFIPNRVLASLLSLIMNIIRATPFVILLIIMLPLTAMIMGTIIGFRAALPALMLSAIPFYARIVYTSFDEVSAGVIEALEAMALPKLRMIMLIAGEARESLIAGFILTLVTLVGFIAAASVIGSGGLGAVAYIHGFQRNNLALMYSATLLMILLVIIIQFIGDRIIKILRK